MAEAAKYVFWFLILVLVIMVGLYIECRMDGGAVHECTQPFRNLGAFIRSLAPWNKEGP